MAFKMIVAFSGILLVSDFYDHIFQELRQQNNDCIVMPVGLVFFLQYRLSGQPGWLGFRDLASPLFPS